MTGRVEIAYQFGFEAAHYFRHGPAEHPYRQLHGHSFTAEVVVAGEPDRETGFVVDFAALEQAAAELRGQLDHTLLNDVPGLAVPSLENIAAWVWEEAEAPLSRSLSRHRAPTILRPVLHLSRT